MSVASRNPFALLGDEDSSSVSVAAPAAKTEQAAPKRIIPGAGVSNAARGGATNNSRGGRGGGRGGRAGAEGGAGDEDAVPKEARSSNRGGARGRGEGRGGSRGGRGAPRGRGRVFDRHSQTGKEDSAKNIHQGWGGDDPKRELDAEDGAVADAAEEGADPAGEKVTPVNGEAAAEGQATEAKNEVAKEEEDNTKTLDEYLAEIAAKRAQIGAKKEARSVETIDPESLGKRLEKQDSEDYYKTDKERQVRQREKKEKQLLEIEQNFNAPPAPARGGGDRGGRGGGRGGDRGRGGSRGRGDRGRGAPRGGRGRGGNFSSGGGANLNLSDDSAFPTLG